MVLLKPIIALILFCVKLDLHSNMVLLKLDNNNANEENTTKFTFQYGAT